MTLQAAIQFPCKTAAGFDVAFAVTRALAHKYIQGHLKMSHPFSLRLVPTADQDHFLGEILVPLVGRQEIETVLELLVTIDMIYRQAHPEDPSLYKSGVVYGLANKTAWFTTPILLKKKKGDCKDVSADRVASLRLAGEKEARCYLKAIRPGQWHVQVQRANGTIEDPSEKLGMRAYFQRRKRLGR